MADINPISVDDCDAAFLSTGYDDDCDAGYRPAFQAWRVFRLLLVSTAGATRTAPYRFFLMGKNMTELELVELKYRVMEGWKTWFRNASFKALMGKLSPTIKSEVILAEDLRVRIVVAAMPDTYGHKSWTLVGAEGEDYGDWDKCDAKVLFDAKNIAFNAETVID